MENKKIPSELAIGIILILAIIIGGAVWIGGKDIKLPKQVQKQETKKEVPANDKTNETAGPVPSEVEGRQTYQNEKAGFSVEYPKDWGPVKTEVFREAISGKGEEFYVYFSNKNFIITGKTTDYQPWEGNEDPYAGTDPFQYCKKLEISIGDCKKINDNISVVNYGNKTDEMAPGPTKIILMRNAFIRNSSNKYAGLAISYNFPDYQNENLDNMSIEEINGIIKEQTSKFAENDVINFDKIISTFKFIDSTDTADWQTYRNEEYGFEVKYPVDWKINEADGEKYDPTNSTQIVGVSKVLCCKISFDEGMSLKIFYSSNLEKYPIMQNILTEQRRGYSLENFEVDKYVFLNFEGIKVITKAGSDASYIEDVQLYQKKGSGFYTVFWDSADPNQKGFTSSTYLEKILSTFKFIN